MRRLAFLIGCLVWGGCRTAPITAIKAPPATTAQACADLRATLTKSKTHRVAPADKTSECHMRFTLEERRAGDFMVQLQKSGWTHDPRDHRVWTTPQTRCVIDQTVSPESSAHPVTVGLGVGGGSGVSTGVGVGMGVGATGRDLVDFKVDCVNP